MTSLSEAYDRRGEERHPRRAAGAALFVVGAAGLLAALVLASTDAGASLGWDRLLAREVAGTVGGLAVPTLLLGVVVALPSSTRESLLAGLGAAVCVAGVGLFVYAYPGRWWGVAQNHLTFEVAAVYTVGAVLTLWYVLSAVATVHVRNNPQGTVTLEIEEEGETTVVEVEGTVDRERLRRIAERQD
ncbi:MAG: hypothetical protein ABEJ23_09900 [Haloarculaceae archaeon]